VLVLRCELVDAYGDTHERGAAGRRSNEERDGMVDALAVGLVGAGPWADLVHAPVLAAGPETRLAGVWARRRDAAAELATRHGAIACPTFDDLLDRCDAVAFCVPPAVQEELAVVAARAGKGLLLEKPIAASLDGARRLAEVVGEASVGSLVVFTARFSAGTRSFVADARASDAFGGYLLNATGAFLEGPFASSPWRHERGALLDIGPHAVDLLSAALGAVVDVRAEASRGWVQITLEHERATSTSLLSCHVPGENRHEVEVFGPEGSRRLVDAFDGETFATIRREFAHVVRARAAHECDVQRGLYVQAILDVAERHLTAH
jgi:predicted dehydrogenase